MVRSCVMGGPLVSSVSSSNTTLIVTDPVGDCQERFIVTGDATIRSLRTGTRVGTLQLAASKGQHQQKHQQLHVSAAATHSDSLWVAVHSTNESSPCDNSSNGNDNDGNNGSSSEEERPSLNHTVLLEYNLSDVLRLRTAPTTTTNNNDNNNNNNSRRQLLQPVATYSYPLPSTTATAVANTPSAKQKTATSTGGANNNKKKKKKNAHCSQVMISQLQYHDQHLYAVVVVVSMSPSKRKISRSKNIRSVVVVELVRWKVPSLSNATDQGLGRPLHTDIATLVPYRMARIATQDDNDDDLKILDLLVTNVAGSIICIVPSASRLSVYVFRCGDESTTQLVEEFKTIYSTGKKGKSAVELDRLLAFSQNNNNRRHLSSCTILNETDLACGLESGAIVVLHDVLTACAEYDDNVSAKEQQQQRQHPTESVVTSQIHWHAHAVATLCVAMDGSLVSGGEEGVIVTWSGNPGDNTTTPIHMLPRIAQRGLRHIVAVPDGVLVYSNDNRLQCFDWHSKRLQWKVQGWGGGAMATASAAVAVTPTFLRNYSHPTRLLGNSGSHSGAPGCLQWFDVERGCVVRQVEVAPFNRISRTERGSTTPWPEPVVTNSVVCETNLVTVDVVPTENTSVGKKCITKSTMFGSVATIRFWRAEHSAFVLVASMAFPHGMGRAVSALAVGTSIAVSVSSCNDFRIWAWDTGNDSSDGEVWCRAKVTIPSGYANGETPTNGAAVSSDGSVVAIVFGRSVTLWDADEVTFLTSIESDDSVIWESVEFCNSTHMVDMILLQSATQVSLQSPYGDCGHVMKGWTWALPDKDKSIVVGAWFFPTNEVVVIGQYDLKMAVSRLVVVRAASGLPLEVEGSAWVINSVPGKVVSVTTTGVHKRTLVEWGAAKIETDLCLYALTCTGAIHCFDARNEEGKAVQPKRTASSSADTLPTLPAIPHNEKTKKRKLVEIGDLTKSVSVDLSTTTTSELPSLRGSFSQAFLGRHLRRRDAE